MKYVHCIILCLCTTTHLIFTCSGLRLKAKDGSIVYARTMDFGQDLKSEIIAIPRNTTFVGILPDNKEGLHWKNKYGILGINGLGIDHIVDGINEKGLVCGLFYFNHYAEFQPLNKEHVQESIAQWELGTYLLSTCATVDDVRKIISTIHVVETVLKNQPNMPAHYVIHDAQGDSLVIEYIKGIVHLYDNPFGVITNSPTFEWHMTNINNYIHLFAPQAKTLALNGIKIFAPGEGNKFLGLPGDFTPPSRFVRLVTLSQTALPVATADQCISQAINIMNNVAVPLGCVAIDTRNNIYDYTQWMIVYDVTHTKLYYRTYDNHNFRYVDAKKVSFDGQKIKRLALSEQVKYADYSEKLR